MFCFERLEILVSVTVKSSVFQDVVLCILLPEYMVPHHRRKYGLLLNRHIEGSRVINTVKGYCV